MKNENQQSAGELVRNLTNRVEELENRIIKLDESLNLYLKVIKDISPDSVTNLKNHNKPTNSNKSADSLTINNNITADTQTEGGDDKICKRNSNWFLNLSLIKYLMFFLLVGFILFMLKRLSSNTKNKAYDSELAQYHDKA